MGEGVGVGGLERFCGSLVINAKSFALLFVSSIEQSSIELSGRAVMTGLDMQSRAVIPTGFFPLATNRQTMSRSVTTPTGVFASSHTGIPPRPKTP